MPRSKTPSFTPIIMFLLAGLVAAGLIFVPVRARQLYGPPDPSLGWWGAVQYSARLLWYDGTLTQPLDPNGIERPFQVEQGESVPVIADRLQRAGLIRSAAAFRTYLVYTGLDKSIQAGEYKLASSLSIVDVARALQDATPEDVTFVVLAGWRTEEIAASLATSGLALTSEEFIAAARTPPPGYDFLPPGRSGEGLFYPDVYIIPRVSGAEDLRDRLIRNFALHLTLEMRDGISRQGLSVYEAVTLASIVEREAVDPDEQALIASVFLNRMNAGIKMDSDATVQYALGYDPLRQTWWTNPLSAEDLQVDSPFNTYAHAGLPPGPISNPGLGALRAVAFPAETPYYYFRARCDGSGLHLFAVTFEEHLANGCP